MSIDFENFKKVAEYFRDEMIKYIEDNWEEAGCAEKNMPDAATYLGHSVKNMSQEEIDEEVSEIQLAYYTEGEADLEKVVAKFVEVMEAVEA